MSAKYTIFETDEFIKRLGKFPAQDVAFAEAKLKDYIYPQISAQPTFGKNIKKLRGYEPETWRYRLGRFRLFYAVDEDEKTVYVLTLYARKDAYR